MEQAPMCWTETAEKESKLTTTLRRWTGKSVVTSDKRRGILLTVCGDIALVKIGETYESFRAKFVGFEVYRLTHPSFTLDRI